MAPPSAAKFQIKINSEWHDYDDDEDRVLKGAYLAGFPNARYTLRGQRYECDFERMVQRNATSGKSREIRPPYKLRSPTATVIGTLVPKGGTTVVTVLPGAPGTTIEVPHPRLKGEFISVDVPATAKVGQAILVPIPAASDAMRARPIPTPTPPVVAPAPTPAATRPSAKKVVSCVAGAAVVGGALWAGGVFAEHIGEDGWDATMSDMGDVLEEDIVGGTEEAFKSIGDAGDSAGDFILDLF